MSMKQTLIGLGLVAASGAALALPNIAVLATGGTIAGAGASATGASFFPQAVTARTDSARTRIFRFIVLITP